MTLNRGPILALAWALAPVGGVALAATIATGGCAAGNQEHTAQRIGLGSLVASSLAAAPRSTSGNASEAAVTASRPGPREGSSRAKRAAWPPAVKKALLFAGLGGDMTGLSGLSSVHPDTPLDQLLADGDRPMANNGLCPPDMASIDDLYCVDRYEASLVEVTPSGDERAWSPFYAVEGHTVRAVSEPGVLPQGYVSGLQAQEACARSGKRLCRAEEWRKACMGPKRVTFGYADRDERGRCNDHGRGPVTTLLGIHPDDPQEWNWDNMNRPELNQLEGTLAKTGEHPGCTNGYGVYDMVGNLHEWVADGRGAFQGGYYQDTHINGDGCFYKTVAHGVWYHDYSTGFRCCADVAQ